MREPYRFKFRFIGDNGHPEGLFRTKGELEGDVLRLGTDEVPVVAIVATETRDDRLILLLASQGPDPIPIAISASSGVVEHLKGEIDVVRSRLWADGSRASLREKGREHAYREQDCASCGATLILTDMPVTPQVYCHFCKAFTTEQDGGHQEPAVETTHRLCDECGLFSAPRRFTIFYFYFLLVVYGFSSRTTWRCPACMRGEAWKMFFGNLLFVLGVPVAIVQLLRAYGSSRVGRYQGLDQANVHARAGRAREALGLYEQIAERIGPCAGVKYNAGMALVQARKHAEAVVMLEASLADCSNYGPSYGALVKCYARTGQEDRLLALQRVWGDGDEEPGAAPA